MPSINQLYKTSRNDNAYNLQQRVHNYGRNNDVTAAHVYATCWVGKSQNDAAIMAFFVISQYTVAT